MSGWATLIFFGFIVGSAQAAFSPEKVKPGQTSENELQAMLGRPIQVMREGTREYHFYRLGVGATMDATVALRGGVVEYVTYLCEETLDDVKSKFKDEQSVTSAVRGQGGGLSGALSQLTYPVQGKGFLYKPKSRKVKACVTWVPGRKFDEI